MKTKKEIIDKLYADAQKLLDNIEVMEMVGDWQLADYTKETLNVVLSKLERLENEQLS